MANINITPKAPISAKYIVQQADGILTNEQALGALSTGLMKVTTTTGAITTAIAADVPDLSATYAVVAQTFYIGTTQVAINRGSGALTLAGLTLTTPDIGVASGTSLDVSGTLEAGSSNITLTTAAGLLKHEAGGIEADISAIVKGGILTGTGTNTIGIKVVGTNDYVLTADSTAAGGVKWADLDLSYLPLTGGSMTGLITSTSDTGFATTGTFVPDASRLDYAYSMGNRALELTVNLANAASQNLELFQANVNLTATGGAPTSTSTVALMRLRSTHDTTDMPNLRLRNLNSYMDVQKNLQDAYGHIAGIDFYTNAVAVGGEAAVGVFNMDANSAVTGNVRGIIVNMHGAGLPSTTSIGVEVRTDGGTATLAEGIRIWSVGGNSITTGLNFSGNITNDISLQKGEIIKNTTDGIIDITADYLRLSDDLQLQDDKYLYLSSTDPYVWIKYSYEHGIPLFSNDASYNADIAAIGSWDIYANTAADAGGNWAPQLTLGTDGVVTILNTTQGSVGDKYLLVDMTDGIRLDTGGNRAIIKADNIATSDKIFQFPNASGTLLTSVSTASALTSVGTLTGLVISGDIDMANTKSIGIADNELITFNTAGTIVVSGAILQVDAIQDVGNDATLSFSGTNGVDVVNAFTAGTIAADTTVSGTTITASTGFALGDGDYIGVTGNETLVFATAGTITVSGATLVTSGNIELGHATDTTLSRSAAGVLAVEGVVIPSISSTVTLTNKRITPRISTEASSAEPTINTDNVDAHSITALALAITSMTTNLSGTPTNFQRLTIRFLDNGTGRAITWGASFEDNGVALPATTTASKLLTVGFIYDTVSSKWGCVAVADET